MMTLSKTDKKMFEYLSHLKFGKVDHRDLSWGEYEALPNSDWQFPKELEEYFEECFCRNADVIQGKKLLDIGCEYGNKIPWFDKFDPEALTCIDPNPADLYIANYVGSILKTPTVCVETKAEDYQLSADTIFMLSSNHHFDDQFLVYSKLDCEHLIIDTWTDKVPINKVLERLDKKFILERNWFFRPNRIVMRYRKK